MLDLTINSMVIYPFKLPEGKFFPCPLKILGRRYLGGSACLDQWPNGDSPQLLGGFSMFFATPLKKMKIKWFDKIPSIWENGKIKCMFQTSKPPTSQSYNDSLVSTPGVFCFNVCVLLLLLWPVQNPRIKAIYVKS